MELITSYKNNNMVSLFQTFFFLLFWIIVTLISFRIF